MKRIIFSAIICMAMALGSHDAQAATIDGSLGIELPGIGLNISVGDILGVGSYGYAPVQAIPVAVAAPMPPRHHHMAPPPPHRHQHMAPPPPPRHQHMAPPPRHSHAPRPHHHR